MPGLSSIGGIISGLDTNSIIETIISYEKKDIELYLARRAEFTQRLASWQTINSYLLGFKTQLDILSKPSIWNTKTASSSDTDIIDVSTTESAGSGIYYISVDQLARNHQIASQGFSDSTAIIGTGTVEIKVGDNAPVTITVEAGNHSLVSLKNAINNANAGVSASIINDGSKNNPFRLILTANETGADNQITFTSNLTGGTPPDFSTPAFDMPETILWSSAATSNPALGSTAAYTGTKNKTYTFTVGGTGQQTVGNAPITINWTDSDNNTGTITVNTAGEIVALDGTGAEGLTLTMSSGILVAGDTFQVQAFSPTLQSAQDAILKLGDSGNGGSPITVTSSSNNVTDLIDGVTLDLKKTTATAIDIIIEDDTSSVSATIKDLVTKYNAFASFADEQLSYNQNTKKAGVLLGDTSLINIVSDIRATILQKVPGLEASLNKLSDIGVKFDKNGELVFNDSTFRNKLESNPDLVRSLFVSTGISDNAYIKYISSGPYTVANASGYNVDITTAAKRGDFTALAVADPAVTNLVLDATNNNIKLKINGISSNSISLEQKTYVTGDELADEIEKKINADNALGTHDVEVQWIDLDDTGYFKITSTQWGANSKVELDTEPTSSGHTILGLTGGASSDGANVAGTINGEEAEGVGQILTGIVDNETTAGLKLKIELTADMLLDGPEGRIVLTKGVAALQSDKIDRYTNAQTGILNSRSNSLQKQIDNLKDQVVKMEEQIERKRESLYMKFTAMEETLAKLQSQQMYLSSVTSSLSQNQLGSSKK